MSVPDYCIHPSDCPCLSCTTFQAQEARRIAKEGEKAKELATLHSELARRENQLACIWALVSGLPTQQLEGDFGHSEAYDKIIALMVNLEKVTAERDEARGWLGEIHSMVGRGKHEEAKINFQCAVSGITDLRIDMSEIERENERLEQASKDHEQVAAALDRARCVIRGLAPCEHPERALKHEWYVDIVSMVCRACGAIGAGHTQTQQEFLSAEHAEPVKGQPT